MFCLSNSSSSLQSLDHHQDFFENPSFPQRHRGREVVCKTTLPFTMFPLASWSPEIRVRPRICWCQSACRPRRWPTPRRGLKTCLWIWGVRRVWQWPCSWTTTARRKTLLLHRHAHPHCLPSKQSTLRRFNMSCRQCTANGSMALGRLVRQKQASSSV